jgi:hypothetical protein
VAASDGRGQAGSVDHVRLARGQDVRRPGLRSYGDGELGSRGDLHRIRRLHGRRLDGPHHLGRQLHDHRSPGGQHRLQRGDRRPAELQHREDEPVDRVPGD